MRAEGSLGQISSPLAESNLQVSGDHDLSRLKDMRRGNDLTTKIVFVGQFCGLNSVWPKIRCPSQLSTHPGLFPRPWRLLVWVLNETHIRKKRPSRVTEGLIDGKRVRHDFFFTGLRTDPLISQEKMDSLPQGFVMLFSGALSWRLIPIGVSLEIMLFVIQLTVF